MNKLAKVCHITSKYPYLDQRILAQECTTLAQVGYDVHFLCSGAPERDIGPITLHCAPALSGSLLRKMRQGAKDFFPLAQDINAQIYHIHEPELLPLAKRLKRAGKIVIYEARVRYGKLLAAQYARRAFYWRLVVGIFEVWEAMFAKRMDVVLGGTPYVRDYFHHRGCVAIDVNNYPSLDEAAAQVPEATSKERALCYIGDLSAQFGLLTMVKAVHEAECTLYLIGNFVSDSDRVQAEKLPGWSRVVLVKPDQKQKIQIVLGKVRAGLVFLPSSESYGESEPIQFCQYMHAGLPVICSKFLLWKEIMSQFQCGYCVDADDEHEIAGLVRWLFEHPDRAEESGRHAHKLALERYNWENERKKLLTAYEQVLKHYQQFLAPESEGN